MKWTNFLKDTICQNLHTKKNNLSRPITTKEIESVINKLSKQKTPLKHGIGKEMIPILYNLLNRSRMEVRINIKTKEILHLKINHWVEVGQETEANDKRNITL